MAADAGSGRGSREAAELALPWLGALLLLSGFGALVAETTWLRWLRLLLGATAPAVSATLAAAFAGQAAGAALGARLAARSRVPLRTYAALEGCAVAAAAATPALLSLGRVALDPIYDGARESPALLLILRLGVAGIATFPAACAFGATLPLLLQAGVGPPAALGRRGSALYGLQTLGGCLGVGLAAFGLPGQIGVSGTYAMGLGATAAAGCLAWLLDRHRRAHAGEQAARPAEVTPAARRGTPLATGLLALAALSGLGSFAAQVLFVQSFALVHNQTSHAFGAVLVVVLGSLAGGAFLVSVLLRTGRVRAETIAVAASGAAAVGLAVFPRLFARASDGLAYLGSDGAWPGYLLRAVGLVVVSAGPALLASGMLLPAVLALAGEAGGGLRSGTRAGRLLAVNTVGAIVGSLAGAWLLLPSLGPWASFFALAALYAACAVGIGGTGPSRRVRAAMAGAGLAALLVFLGPASVPLVPLRPGDALVHVEPTAAGLVAVVDRGGQRHVQIDNHYLLGGVADRVHQQRQGHLPLLLRPGAERVAFLGAATGSSASAAAAHRVDDVVVVELVPGVARAAQRWLSDAGGSVYGLPATDVVLDDARNYIRSTRTDFDVIVSDLFLPWRSGAGALYTAEHFEAIRRRLRKDGLFCQWLPLYQLSEEELLLVLATFLDVFPEAALFRGDFYGGYPIAALVGYRDTPAPAADVARAAAALGERGVRDRWVTHPDGVFSLYVGPLAPLIQPLADRPRNRDDRPLLEMGGARGHAGGSRGKLEPLTGRQWVAFTEQVAGRARVGPDPIFPDLPESAEHARRGGHALQAAGALYVDGRLAEASRALERAMALLPRSLLAEAEADPTAAELWWVEPRAE